MIGQILLGLAFILITVGVFLPLAGIALKKDYLKYVYQIAFGVAGLLSLTIIILAINFLNNNYKLTYVAEYSNRALGWIYKLSAVYAGQAGSLLFWGWLIALFTAIVAYLNRDRIDDFMAYAMSVLFSITWLFVFLNTFASWLYDMNLSANLKSFGNIFLLGAIVLTVIWSGVIAWQKSERDEDFAWVIYSGLAIATMLFLFRLGIVNTQTVGTDPFALAQSVPPDGQGLNPLLQNYGMIFHPPTLFIGFAGFSVPFAYAMAALFTGKLDNEWLKQSRGWLIFSWLFLGIGIILGAQWAYMELGWGGYWAWDPVENASLMPWLVATALVHSALAQRRKNFLKVWNMFLVSITFVLCIYGTYLTRSGVVSSVHSFGDSPLGNFILTFVAVSFVGSIVFIFMRLKDLKSQFHFENFLSKEFMFISTNFIFAVAALIVFYGTDYKIIAEIIKSLLKFANLAVPAGLEGAKEIKKEFYEILIGPLSIVLFAVMVFCPLISWKKANVKKLLIPAYAIAGMGVVLLPLFLFGLTKHPFALLAVGILIVMGYISSAEIFKSFWHKSKFNWDRIGAYVVHFGMAIAFIGIVVSSVYNVEKSATLKAGESTNLAGYAFKYEGARSDSDALKQRNIAMISMWSGSNQLSTLEPSIDSYGSQGSQGQTTSEPGLYYNLKEDVYVALTNVDESSASIKILYNPMVIWFWMGGVVMTLGGLVLLFSKLLPGAVLVGRKEESVEPVLEGQNSCTKCGSSYNESDKFCKNCGSKLEKTIDKNRCLKCGAVKSQDAKFCINCGAKY